MIDEVRRSTVLRARDIERVLSANDENDYLEINVLEV
jgi:hypothetical protein